MNLAVALMIFHYHYELFQIVLAVCKFVFLVTLLYAVSFTTRNSLFLCVPEVVKWRVALTDMILDQFKTAKTAVNDNASHSIIKDLLCCDLKFCFKFLPEFKGSIIHSLAFCNL